jgi:hypothetical protein
VIEPTVIADNELDGQGITIFFVGYNGNKKAVRITWAEVLQHSRKIKG